METITVRDLKLTIIETIPGQRGNSYILRGPNGALYIAMRFSDRADRLFIATQSGRMVFAQPYLKDDNGKLEIAR